MKSNSNYEIINEKAKQKLLEIGKILATSIEEIPNYGFTLMLFSYGKDGELFYLSSANREDMIKMLDEFKAKLQEQPRNTETGYKL